eukprot:37219_1
MDQSCIGWSALDGVDFFLFVIALIVGIYITYKGWQGMRAHKAMRRLFKIFYAIEITVYFLATIGFFMNLLFDHHFQNFRHTRVDEASSLMIVRYSVNDTTFVCYFALLIILCSLLLSRLILTFQNSAYKLDKWIANLFYVITTICALTMCAGFGAIGAPVLGAALQIMAGLIYLISSGILVIIFVKKLNALILITNTDDVAKSQEGRLNQRQLDLINSASRYLLLSFVGLISTFFCIVFTVIAQLNWSCYLHRIIFVWMVKVDMIINLTCFYFQFGFSKEDYKRCCVHLDNWMKRNMSNKTLVKLHHVHSNPSLGSVSTPTVENETTKTQSVDVRIVSV